jgi:membrane protease YdiL (CAAX protease family)
MEANKISLKTFSAAIVAIFIVETGFRLATGGRVGSPLPALGILRCMESLLLLVIAWSLEGDPRSIGLCRSKMPAGFIRGLIWSACFGVAAGILFLVLLAAGINALELLHSAEPASWQHMMIFFLVGGVIGPVAEEIFFRGIIYGFFRQWGAIVAIILSTLIFVFIHPVGGSPPVTQFIGGIVFAVAYEKEQNLVVPITIHCLGNLAIFSLSIFI